jgi:hypothetical protein
MPAPIGHARGLSPNSQENQAEQERLSAFDGKQQKPSEMVDKKLSICR